MAKSIEPRVRPALRAHFAYLKFAAVEATLAFLPVAVRSTVVVMVPSVSGGTFEVRSDLMFAGSILSTVAVFKYFLSIVIAEPETARAWMARHVGRLCVVTAFAFFALFALGLFSVAKNDGWRWNLVSYLLVPLGGIAASLRSASDYFYLCHRHNRPPDARGTPAEH